VFLSTGDYSFDVFPDGGGIQNQIWGISNEMVKMGHEVHILTRNRDFNFLEIDGINIHGVDTSLNDQVLTRLMFSKNAEKKIKEIKPDILNLSERFSAYFPSKLDIPKTFTTHNYDAFEFYRTYSYNYNKLNLLFFDIKKKCENNVMLASDTVITLNKSIDEYLHSINVGKTTIIPNAINYGLYNNNGDGGFILCAGRLNKVKGFDYLIRAYSEVKTSHKLIIIGKGPDESRLKQLVKVYNLKEKVEFIPWVTHEKLRDYMSKCTAFVLPSLFETFGIVLLEAMASGKPVIASNIMGPKDIISNNIDGILFEKGNVNELKEALEECLFNERLRSKLGNNARFEVEKNYSFEKIAKKLIAIYGLLI
jgi:glycosyltransferase involved in cell wall biosynthesis